MPQDHTCSREWSTIVTFSFSISHGKCSPSKLRHLQSKLQMKLIVIKYHNEDENKLIKNQSGKHFLTVFISCLISWLSDGEMRSKRELTSKYFQNYKASAFCVWNNYCWTKSYAQLDWKWRNLKKSYLSCFKISHRTSKLCYVIIGDSSLFHRWIIVYWTDYRRPQCGKTPKC